MQKILVGTDTSAAADLASRLPPTSREPTTRSSSCCM